MTISKTISLFLPIAFFLCNLPLSAQLQTARHSNTTTLMADGDIMTAGGIINSGNTPTNTVEIFFTTATTWGWGTPMNVSRSSHTATLLSDGRILVAGGFSAGTPVNTAEIYNPITKIWTPSINNMAVPRGGHTATLLSTGPNSGNVLLCGGQSAASNTTITNTCDIFNTLSNTFSPATSMNSSRMGHTASLFSSGRVFISGGLHYTGTELIYLSDNEIYDSVNNIWSPVDSLAIGRAQHSATVLNSGNVLIAGGYNAVSSADYQFDRFSEDDLKTQENQNQVNQGFLESVEMFDPGGARVPLTGSDYKVMPYRNSSHGTVLQVDGKIHLLGGYGNFPVSYFQTTPIIEDGSYLELSNTGDPNESTVNNGLVQFPLTLQLSREVSGRLVNGNMYFSPTSNPEYSSIMIENVEIYIHKSTAIIDGLPIVKDPSTGKGGIFQNSVSLDNIGASIPAYTAVFSPLGVELDVSIDAAVLTFPPIAPDAQTSLTGTSLTMDISFLLPTIYVGSTITATGNITGGMITDNEGIYVVSLAPDADTGSSGGVANFVSETITAITVDGVDYGLVTVNNVQFLSLDGLVVNTTNVSLAPADITIMDDEAEAFTLDIDFVASRIWLTQDNEDTSYSFDQSTVVVREMIFADDLRYAPSESKWGFNEESTAFLPLFNHTLLLSPSDDLVTIGGRNCESSPATDCLRTNKTFNPTTSELVYISQNHDKWEEESSLNTKRAFHTSTLLPDSSILTCGGSDGTQPLSSCELLNPISQEWDFVYPMNYTRSNHTATLLANGTVLIVGGKLNSSTAAINTAEIYYPDTYKFVETSPMASPRANHTATLLPDGNILVTAGGTMSGYSNTSEIYITTEAAWQTVSDNLTTGRSQHTATLLKNGNVMIIGGIKSGALNSTEIYIPITRTWNVGPALNMKRYDHTANLLKNGRVLVSGGSNGLEILKTAEIYNGVSWTYTLDFPTAGAGEDMNLRRENHTSTLLPNGKLLIAGGEEPSSAHGYLEGYNGDFNTWKEQGEMEPRVHHTTVLMSNGYLINIGGFDGANYLDSTEKNYFGSIPDSLGRETAIARQPLISTGTVTFDKGDRATLLSDTSSFHGITEASGGGGGAMNSSYHNPRVYIQQIDNPSGFLTDLTTSFYTVYDIQDANSDWGKTTSSITIIMPPSSNQIPYGFYNLWVANNAVFSNGFTVQVTSQRPVGIVADLVGAVVDETTINWSWDNGTIAVPPGNSDTYVVFSSSNNVFISTATLSDPGLFTQNGLTPNTMSSIKVAGSNLGGYGDFLKSSTYYTLAATPQNLTVNSASFETAELEWSPNSNSSITRYELSMSASNNAGDCFTTDISTPVVFNDNHVSTSATLNQLSANQFYCFRVRARNGSEVLTTFSNEASTITVGNVNNVQGTAINISEIRWSWDPTEGADHYNIYDITDATCPENAIPLSTGSLSVEYYSQINLSTNTKHSIAVMAAHNAGGGPVYGPLSTSHDVYTLAVAPLPGVPNTITNITTGSLNVNWIANGNPEDTPYKVELFTEDGSGEIYTIGTEVYMPGLTPNTSYSAIITAYNGDEIPNESTELGTKYTLAQPPLDVNPLQIAMSGVTIAWDTNDNPENTHYQVRGSTDNFITISTYVAFSNYFTDSEIEINGLLTDTTYYFDVAARNNEPNDPGKLKETAKIQCVPNALTLSGPDNAPHGSVAGTSDPSKTVIIDGELPNGRYVTMSIPAGSFAGATSIAISSSAINRCGYLIDGKPLAVAIFSKNAVQPQVPITLTLDYSTAEANDKITANEKKLVLARYNPVSGQCLPLNTTVNVGVRTITASLNHFSEFQLMLKTAAANLNNISVYPNPFYINRGQGFITIDNIPAGSKVRIYTLSGTKIWSGTATSTGLITWNGVNKHNELVASGIYLCVIDSSAGKKIIKLAVER